MHGISDERDPLGVLRTTREVVDAATHVQVAYDRVREVAQEIAGTTAEAGEWPSEMHPTGATAEETANMIFVLDALNFCFWPLPNSDRPRWQVTFQGETYDGYWALTAALRRALANDVPLADPTYLANISEAETRNLLAGDPGSAEIPLLADRAANLNEAGQALRDRWDGTFLTAIEHANGSAARLVGEVIQALPSFDDVAEYRGKPARFYKRAQILISDIHGAFGGTDSGRFDDLDTLTAFADYKVPQVLRRFGILEYSDSLQESIRNYELIPAGDEREVEIRAATIWAVELLRQELANSGVNLAAYEIDWRIWQIGQMLPVDQEPYHRTLTIFY